MSCQNRDECSDVNLGEVTRISEDVEEMNLGNIDSLIYIDSDSNLVHFPIVGNRVDRREREIRFVCLEDDNFYTAKYETVTATTGMQIKDQEQYLKIEELADLPLKANFIPSGMTARTEIINNFANQVIIWVHNDIGSPIKANIFTKSKNASLDLEQINQYNNDDDLKHFDSIEINGRNYDNVYRVQREGGAAAEIFYSQAKGIIQFTDKEGKVLTLHKIIFY